MSNTWRIMLDKPQSTNTEQGSHLRAAPCAWWASLPLGSPARPPGSRGWWGSLRGVCSGCAGTRVDGQHPRHPHRSPAPRGDSLSVRSSSSCPLTWTRWRERWRWTQQCNNSHTCNTTVGRCYYLHTTMMRLNLTEPNSARVQVVMGNSLCNSLRVELFGTSLEFHNVPLSPEGNRATKAYFASKCVSLFVFRRDG